MLVGDKGLLLTPVLLMLSFVAVVIVGVVGLVPVGEGLIGGAPELNSAHRGHLRLVSDNRRH